MSAKYCPRKFNANTVDSTGLYGDCQCEEEDCAWWNTHFGMCCQAVDAHLKAEEAKRQEELGTREWRQRATMGPEG